VDLRHAQRRPGEPFVKIRDVLADQIASRRDQANVALLFEDGVDRHAQHDFGLARSRRRLEEKLEDIGVEPGADSVDRRALIVGEGKSFAGLDELVREGDRLRVAVDRRPNLAL
jgi:hypothetical protein